MADVLDLDCLRVVLVRSQNPLNIGAAARAMSNFGFPLMRVVNPDRVAFRGARSAVGAAALLASAEEFSCVSDAIADCTLVVGTVAAGRKDPRHPYERLEAGAGAIRQAMANAGRVALLFGSEESGLSNEELSHCHWLMNIPTRDAHSSMNLGQAVAVCLYELIRRNPTREQTSDSDALANGARGIDPRGIDLRGIDPAGATAEELDRLTSLLLSALTESGYVNPEAAVSTEEKTRRLVRRLRLSGADAEVLLGMLRQIVWKLR